jgi:PKD repeat protein
VESKALALGINQKELWRLLLMLNTLQQCLLKMLFGIWIALISCSIFAQSTTQTSPTASFTAIKNPFDPLTVFVNAELSMAPNGAINTYTWLASDGQTASEFNTKIRFSEKGIYTMILQVIDTQGLTDTSWYTMNVGNKNTNCHPHALYFLDTQELIIPFLTLYDPFNRTPVKEEMTAVYTVTLQADAEFNFSIKPESLAFVDTVEKNSCHALYADIDRTLHIPFINVMDLPDSAFVYQATLEHGEDDVLTIKRLEQIE